MTPPPAEVVYSAQMVARRRAVRAARRSRIRRAVFGVLALAGLAYGGWALAHSSLFALDGIEVAGVRRISETDVLAASGVRVGMNVLSMDPARVARRIETLPYVRRVVVKRIYPSKIRIVITERTPAAHLVAPSGQWILDASGIPLERTEAGEGLALIRAGALHEPIIAGTPVEDLSVREALAIWRSLPAGLRPAVSALDASAASAISLQVHGIRVVLGSRSELEAKIRVLELLLARAQAEGRLYSTIDVRAPERPAARLA